VDTTAHDADTPSSEDEAKRQSRNQARAFASQRRQINELQRMVGNLQGQLQASRAPAQEGAEPARSEPTEVERLRAEMREQEAARVGRSFWSSAAKEAKDKGINGFGEAQELIRTGEVPTSPVVSHYLTEEADNKAALVVWLADNPDEAERIAGLDPVKASAALAKQDARLSAKPAKKTTEAPAPLTKVGGSSQAVFDPGKGTMDDYAKWRRSA
jgi:hypothetical protein